MAERDEPERRPFGRFEAQTCEKKYSEERVSRRRIPASDSLLSGFGRLSLRIAICRRDRPRSALLAAWLGRPRRATPPVPGLSDIPAPSFVTSAEFQRRTRHR